MPDAAMPDAAAPTESPPSLRRFSREDYYKMAAAGVFGPEEHVELIDGAIIRGLDTTSPQNFTHAEAVSRLANLLPGLIDLSAYHTRVQVPLVLSSDPKSASEPEPDVALVRGGAAAPRSEHPRAGDAILVVEVSDATLPYDRTVKEALYARHQIPCYWIVNCPERIVEVYTEPAGTPEGSPSESSPSESSPSESSPSDSEGKKPGQSKPGYMTIKKYQPGGRVPIPEHPGAEIDPAVLFPA